MNYERVYRMPTSFTYVKKGYNPVEVDNYIETLENIVKGYKEKDAAIKNAIVNAQIAADKIVSDAEKKAENIADEAVTKVKLIRSSVEKQRILLKNFQDDYNALINRYVHDFEQRDVAPVASGIDELERYLDTLISPAPLKATQSISPKEPTVKNEQTQAAQDDNADIAELLR